MMSNANYAQYTFLEHLPEPVITIGDIEFYREDALCLRCWNAKRNVKIHEIFRMHGINVKVIMLHKSRKVNDYLVTFATEDDQNMAIMMFGNH